MKALIAYYSYRGNTKRIAEMKSGLNVRFDEATLRTSMKDIENWIHNITE